MQTPIIVDPEPIIYANLLPQTQGQKLLDVGDSWYQIMASAARPSEHRIRLLLDRHQRPPCPTCHRQQCHDARQDNRLMRTLA